MRSRAVAAAANAAPFTDVREVDFAEISPLVSPSDPPQQPMAVDGATDVARGTMRDAQRADLGSDEDRAQNAKKAKDILKAARDRISNDSTVGTIASSSTDGGALRSGTIAAPDQVLAIHPECG